MPSQSRSQRRRQAARQQRRAAASSSAGAGPRAASTGPTIPLETSAGPVARPARRVLTRPAPEPIDYSQDYTAARRDLRWIALWTVLLFGAMLALKFSGLV